MSIPYINSEKRYGITYANFAKFFRELALEVDANPDTILNYCDHPAVKFLLNDGESTASERTHYLEALSYGDPGVMLSCPGSSLSGLMIRELGTDAQIEKFYHFLQTNSARTFFALTEPEKGSDASALQCNLSPIKNKPGHYYLNGEKCLFGNGAVGKTGVVLARTHAGPLGIRAVLITPDMLDPNKNWIHRENLPMTGLRGAQIAYMRFNNCPISEENLLGEHLRPMQHGMMAVIKTFNRLRTGVGALAIGQAQAVLDFVCLTKRNWNATEKSIYRDLYYKIDGVRHLLRESANIVDSNPFDSYNISVSKIQATKIAEQVITTSISLLEPTIMLENQWIAKCYRDCFAWEYMEGTGNMQLSNVYQAYKNSISRFDIKQNDLVMN